MSTVHADKNVSKYLVSAITRLKSLESVNITKKMTSHYNYGTEEPFICDRFQVDLGFKNKSVQCLLFFDSSNYYLPPDIIFERSAIDKAFEIETINALLPARNWDLKNQDCLYDWFKDMISKIKNPPKSPTPPTEPEKPIPSKNWDLFDTMDDFDDDFVVSNKKKPDSADDSLLGKDASKKKRPAVDKSTRRKECKKKHTTSSKQDPLHFDIFDLDQKVTEEETNNYNVGGGKRAKLSDSVYNAGVDLPEEIDPRKKKRKLIQALSKPLAKRSEKEVQWGEEFMRLWKRKLSDYILQSDGQDTGPVTMYMPFEIDQSSEEWLQYSRNKQKSLRKYQTQNSIPLTEKVSRPKPEAPMIVNFDLMSTHLKVKLISVINTDEQKSAGVDHIDITYKFDQQKSVASEAYRIHNDLKKRAIYFHLFQKKAEGVDSALIE
ncbi:hypothetical protein [Parasitella parasitica]|uniref:Uncharacterized protein n=1 Tax=Parasitella parasitica TaxID=35722 RepID=A0A0B7NV40_9FUNG|nr:hypothetical protein [Parasitella parasitica]